MNQISWFLQFQFLMFVLNIGVKSNADRIRTNRFQRLAQPIGGSRLTMAPGLTTPNLQLNTIESFFTMKMPVSVQFPRVAELTQTFLSTATNNSRSSKTKENLLPDSRAMHARVNSRAKFYKTIESTHRSFGKTCLLRAICEVAEVPFIASSTGIFGEIFDLLLTSSLLDDKNGKLSDYQAAERNGRQSLLSEKDSCKIKYKSCPFSLFKVIELTNDIF